MQQSCPCSAIFVKVWCGSNTLGHVYNLVDLVIKCRNQNLSSVLLSGEVGQCSLINMILNVSSHSGISNDSSAGVSYQQSVGSSPV